MLGEREISEAEKRETPGRVKTNDNVSCSPLGVGGYGPLLPQGIRGMKQGASSADRFIEVGAEHSEARHSQRGSHSCFLMLH